MLNLFKEWEREEVTQNEYIIDFLVVENQINSSEEHQLNVGHWYK